MLARSTGRTRSASAGSLCQPRVFIRSRCGTVASAKAVRTQRDRALGESVAKQVTVTREQLYASELGSSTWPVLVTMATLVALICSIDRGAMSVAILPMSVEYLWDSSTKGLIASAFFLGYTVTNLVGGYVATRYPPKIVLSIGVAVWSLFTLATPLAAESGYLSVLLACRVLMGLGEGVAFPSIQNLVACNVPNSKKPRSLAIVYSGIQCGTIISLLICPGIIRAFEWPSVFFLFGSIGFVWLLAWLPLAKDRAQFADSDVLPAATAELKALAEPSSVSSSGNGAAKIDAPANLQEPALSAEEAVPEEKFNFGSVPWKMIITNKPFLAVLIAHMGWGFGHTICFAWLPNYYFTEYGLAVQESSFYSALPWICSVAVLNGGVVLADGLVQSGRFTRATTRKIMQVAGSCGPALCLLYMAAAQVQFVPKLPLGGAVALFTMTLALGGLCASGHATNHQDLSTKYPGILFGITNSASSLTGTVSTYATGLVLDATSSWSIVFITIAAVYSVTSLCYAAWASAENQFDTADARRNAAQLRWPSAS